MWKRETWRSWPAIKQCLSSISISQGNSNEVTNIILTTEYLTGRLWARASVISISFAKVSFSWQTPFRLGLYNYKLIHFSSHSSDHHGTRNSDYRKNNSNRKASRNTCRVLRHSTYKAVSLNAIMTHESQRLYRKATSAPTFRDFVPRLELLSSFRDFRKSMKLCEMNYFSLFCKWYFILFLTFIIRTPILCCTTADLGIFWYCSRYFCSCICESPESDIQRGFPIVLARFVYCNWSVTLVT